MGSVGGTRRGPFNAIAPAWIKTHFASAVWEDKEDAWSDVYPMKRIGEPKDVRFGNQAGGPFRVKLPSNSGLQ